MHLLVSSSWLHYSGTHYALRVRNKHLVLAAMSRCLSLDSWPEVMVDWVDVSELRRRSDAAPSQWAGLLGIPAQWLCDSPSPAVRPATSPPTSQPGNLGRAVAMLTEIFAEPGWRPLGRELTTMAHRGGTFGRSGGTQSAGSRSLGPGAGLSHHVAIPCSERRNRLSSLS